MENEFDLERYLSGGVEDIGEGLEILFRVPQSVCGIER